MHATKNDDAAALTANPFLQRTLATPIKPLRVHARQLVFSWIAGASRARTVILQNQNVLCEAPNPITRPASFLAAEKTVVG